MTPIDARRLATFDNNSQSAQLQPMPTGDFARALLHGLAERPRRIAPKFFYDAEGSALFDRICDLPEYYPTRTEVALLHSRAGEIAAGIEKLAGGAELEIVEFGAGSSVKIRLLLDALKRARRFVPIDISAEHLHAAAARLRVEYPRLQIAPLVADFSRPLALPASDDALRRVGFFPGSSIGNFSRDEALGFLRRAATLLRGGGLLIGVDLVKDPKVLHAAYNDAAGVTAAFNRNLLARANRELGTAFDLSAFAHYAFYEPREQRIEMHLVSTAAQQIELSGRRFDFNIGDTLHTEDSHKYTVDGFRRLAAEAGFSPAQTWCDAKGWFSVHWLKAPA